MEHAILIPLVAGAVMILAIAAVMFRSQAIPNSLAWPLIVGALLLALPYLQSFNYDGPWGKISTQIRDVKVEVKGEIATNTANTDSNLHDIKLKVSEIHRKLFPTSTDATSLPAYRENRKTTILVYYTKGLNEKAEQIRDYLLDAGYKSSATYTDFEELGSTVGKPGSTRFVFTAASASTMSDLRAKLKTAFPAIFKTTEDRLTDKVGGGDAQVLLF
ncbi:hypothetical protein [Rhodoplanes sp. SY1]|uniref:hypothetical protein n=1 Tax=Rhodoplanes sp. SY1 TaxID=3166646 RepID=UPI0038B54608